MTHIHFVVDTWQYDGGVDVLYVTNDYEKAMLEMIRCREGLEKANKDYEEKFGFPLNSPHRIEAIQIQTHEVK